MVTTKEITVEYTQEEMRRELNCFAIKNISSIQKKTVMQYMSGGGDYKSHRKHWKITEVSNFISITLNISELNSPFKKQRLAEWIFKKMMVQLYDVYKKREEKEVSQSCLTL